MHRVKNTRRFGMLAATLLSAALIGNLLGWREASAQVLGEEYWQQEVDYEIRVTLDVDNHMLTGASRIVYHNNSPDTLRAFYMHLYPNAFRSKTSPLIRDYLQGTLYFFVGLPKSMRGWINVTGLTVNGTGVQFAVDGTVLSSAFPKPLPPGATATIDISFNEKIMKRLGRAGYVGDQYDMAQWYPKMAVYDKNGWHPDQYRMGEFYGEFGTYDVYLTLPEKFVIAATGMPIEGDPGWKKNPLRRRGGHPGRPGGASPASGPPAARIAPQGARPSSAAAPQAGGGAEGTREIAAPPGIKTVHFRAEKVHDFAWCANPSFIVQDTLYHDLHVMTFFRPWNRAWVDTSLAQGLRAMQWLEEIAGPYPYPQISIVDSPTRGGMEYPMLVMDGYVDESLVLHELSHQYFYGVLANNERAEAWLDEGFAQYSTFWYTEDHYGPYGKTEPRPFPYSLFPRRLMWDDIAAPVVRLHRTGYAEPIATPTQDFKNGFDIMPYIGAPLFLRALRYTVGDEPFRKILRTYYDRWKFKHVDEEAFRSVCEEVSGMDLKDLFQEWLHTTKDCDYKVSHVKTRAVEKEYRTELKIDRKGELIMPLALAFPLRDRSTAVERIDGTLRTTDQSFSFAAKPASVTINRDNEILDIYRLDNYAPRRKSFTLDVPFNTYYPLDAYSYRLLPIGYYNDADGGKLGLRVRGSYDNYYRRFTLQSLYGFESERTDFFASFESPTKYFGRDAAVHLEGFHREGRQGVSLEVTKIRRKSLFDPLAQHLSFAVSYREVTDTSYVFPYTYEEGKTFTGSLGFSISPKTDLFATSLALSLDRTLWWGDFRFEKITAALRIWPAIRFNFPLKPDLRFFIGTSNIDPPLQERFDLAGASVIDKERYFWLRSVGAFPEEQYHNFHVAGDANLRGYYDGTFAFKRLFASNIELQLPFPLPVDRRLSRALDRRLYLFYDWGTVMDDNPLEGLPPSARSALDEKIFDRILVDAGVGVRFWKISAEFPVYLNHPPIVGEKDQWDFRWTIGFTRLF
jgi:hypothetical protein